MDGLPQLSLPTKRGPLAKIINRSALYSMLVMLRTIQMQVASVVDGEVTAITAAAVIMVAAVTMVGAVIVVVVMAVEVVVIEIIYPKLKFLFQ